MRSPSLRFKESSKTTCLPCDASTALLEDARTVDAISSPQADAGPNPRPRPRGRRFRTRESEPSISVCAIRIHHTAAGNLPDFLARFRDYADKRHGVSEVFETDPLENMALDNSISEG